MNAEAHAWLRYAAENLAVGQLSLDAGYFNAAIQNAQQALEKALKARLIEDDVVFPKTHRIQALKELIERHGRKAPLTLSECEAFDAVYMNTRYPLESALPDFAPDRDTTQFFYWVAA